MSTEIERFESLTKRIARDCRKLAASADLEYGDAARKITRAIDRAHDLARFQADPEAAYAVCSGLLAARRFAGKSAALNRREGFDREIARLDREIARLDREIREARANEGGFLKEIRVTAARRASHLRLVEG